MNLEGLKFGEIMVEILLEYLQDIFLKIGISHSRSILIESISQMSLIPEMIEGHV